MSMGQVDDEAVPESLRSTDFKDIGVDNPPEERKMEEPRFEINRSVPTPNLLSLHFRPYSAPRNRTKSGQVLTIMRVPVTAARDETDILEILTGAVSTV